MIRALIVGKLANNPQERTTKTSKPFAVARVSVPMGEDGYISCSVICFESAAVTRLLQLAEGAGVALGGTLKVGTWQAQNCTVKPYLDMVADEVAATTPRPKKAKTERAGSHTNGGEFFDLPGVDDLGGQY